MSETLKLPAILALSSQCLDRGIPDKQMLVEKSPPGSTIATPITPRPIGASQPQTLASILGASGAAFYQSSLKVTSLDLVVAHASAAFGPAARFAAASNWALLGSGFLGLGGLGLRARRRTATSEEAEGGQDRGRRASSLGRRRDIRGPKHHAALAVPRSDLIWLLTGTAMTVGPSALSA